MAKSLVVTELYRDSRLVIRRSPIHRWGVFATDAIEAYEVVEEAPYFFAQADELNAVYDYTYWLDEENLLIGMGLSGLFNHSAEANTAYEVDGVNEVMRHYATRRIEAGEELTLDYGEDNAARFVDPQ